MVRMLIGAILGALLLYLFLYFGGPGYIESIGKKAEETGKTLKHYEQTTKDATKKIGEEYENIRKRFEDGKGEKSE